MKRRGDLSLGADNDVPRRRQTTITIFFLLGVTFLWIRNAPLALILPLWSHGDEIGHLDYVLKLEQGRLPRPDKFIESSLFLLHKVRYDGRYLQGQKKNSVRTPKDLGLAAYSYEAIQPPLPYFIMAVCRAPMKALGFSLFAQVKGLRLLSILMMTAALTILYRTLHRRPYLGLHWSLPLLLIPLLSQDMFFSINTDVYAFFFGCLAASAIFRLLECPLSWSRWAFLAGAVGMAQWAKATAAFLFALWPILTAVLVWVSDRKFRRKTIVLGIVFFLLASIIAAPIVNRAQKSYVFGDQYGDRDKISYKSFEVPHLDLPHVRLFAAAFSYTLIRGEFLWKGVFFNGLPAPVNSKLLVIGFWLFIVFGLLAVVFPLKQELPGYTFVFAAGGTGVVLALLVLYFSRGGIPFYHARYAFPGLYFLMFLYAVGWRRLIPDNAIAAIVPAVLLFGYNAAYTIRLLVAVFS